MSSLSDQHSTAVSAAFLQAEHLPGKLYAEHPTFFELLGDVGGQEVLDLGCGTGANPRMISDRGARRVVGVDASPPMIDIARSIRPAGQAVEYLVHDAFSMPNLGQFDAVTAGFMLNHAPSREQLDAMCRTIFSHLRPGGRFVGTLPNSRYDRHRPLDGRYGVTFDWPHDMRDGDEYVTYLHHVDPPLALTSRYWENETCAAALAGAGLRDVQIRPWQPSRAGFEHFGETFWEPWLDNPLAIAIRAVRPDQPDQPA